MDIMLRNVEKKKKLRKKKIRKERQKETRWSRYKTSNSTKFNDRGKSSKTRN